jgi:tRNA threonylcarbamoyladenosine modification (KEOPS) complex  Pcc1 subunit
MSNKLIISIEFESERHSKIAFNSLRVDKEFNNKSFVDKKISLNLNELIIELKTNELKVLRVCVKSILELFSLICETIDCFDS